MEMQIDKGIPMPLKVSGRRVKIYPFEEMSVGESFFVAGKTSSALCTAAKRAAPLRFSVRHVKENGASGVRVWRIE